MNEESTPETMPHTPKDKRLSLRVAGSQLEWWCAIGRVDRQSLSAMVRYAMDQYVTEAEQAPPSDDIAGPYGGILAQLSSPFGSNIKSIYRSKRIKRTQPRGGDPCDKTIVLRVSATELHRWTLAAEREFCSLSLMMREAVTRHVQSRLDFFSRLREEQEENREQEG